MLIGTRQQGPTTFRLPPLQVPPALKTDLEVNPHLLPKFYAAVGEAVTRSLQDPRTRILVMCESAIKERVELCADVMVTMRRDMKMALHKIFDILPAVFLDSLLAGERADDHAAKQLPYKTWAKGLNPDGTREEMLVSKGSINDEPAPSDIDEVDPKLLADE